MVEHMNRTLNERARSIRLHAGLPKTSWADGISTAAYLINHGPSVPMEFRLPKEIWSGKEVNFSHLKVFCCVSYVHIDSVTHSNLMQSLKFVFPLTMVMRNLAIVFGMNKIEKSSKVEM